MTTVWVVIEEFQGIVDCVSVYENEVKARNYIKESIKEDIWDLLLNGSDEPTTIDEGSYFKDSEEGEYEITIEECIIN